MAGNREVARLADVAAAARVHISTVSRVLNDDPVLSIRPETRERVVSAARLQGYRPNALARALKHGRSGVLALLLPSQPARSWMPLQHSILQHAGSRGYHVAVVEEAGNELSNWSYLVEDGRADGLLAAAPLPVNDDGILANVPHVHLDIYGGQQGNSVVMDESAAIRLFADHVASLGHRVVGLIDGHSHADGTRRRELTARGIFAACGIELTAWRAAPSAAGGWDAATRMLGHTSVPTACAVASLHQLFGVLRALRDAGARVPGDVSVLCLEDDESLTYLSVPVTSISMPLAELGTAAVDALISRIDGIHRGDVVISGPMRLIVRDRTRGHGLP